MMSKIKEKNTRKVKNFLKTSNFLFCLAEPKRKHPCTRMFRLNEREKRILFDYRDKKLELQLTPVSAYCKRTRYRKTIARVYFSVLQM